MFYAPCKSPSMSCHLFPPSPLRDVHVWLKLHLCFTNNTILCHLYHSAPCVVLPVCPQFFPDSPSLLSQSCLFLLWWWFLLNVLFKQPLSVILLPVVLSRFVLHRTETLCAAGRGNSLVIRSRTVVPAPSQRHPECSCPHGQELLKCQEEESTLESLSFFLWPWCCIAAVLSLHWLLVPLCSRLKAAFLCFLVTVVWEAFQLF